ncbi:hypothetical protein HPP_2350 [Hydrangea phyllody phytoplasma]|uniref:DUF2963 domain-containing protein n=2 Tax=16SrI (Aster yellows group) TaxID=3042590 RepID=A0ABQ5PRX7_9MOLU|nr:hypothetical protein HPP_2350 [Hydrangea phyllody phytoplasma]GLH61168.1 hypothetical protein RHYP_1130 [Rhus yellows phytoplasma]GLH62043.1 hypothetical protein HP2P_4500 [Hydrangea phyllody phytoplasma]
MKFQISNVECVKNKRHYYTNRNLACEEFFNDEGKLITIIHYNEDGSILSWESFEIF